MDLRHLLEQAQNLERAFNELDERLKGHQVVGRSGDGGAEVRMDGRGDVLALRIDEALLAGGAARVAGAVLAALREATAASRSYREEQRARLTGGLRIPEF